MIRGTKLEATLQDYRLCVATYSELLPSRFTNTGLDLEQTSCSVVKQRPSQLQHSEYDASPNAVRLLNANSVGFLAEGLLQL